MERSCPCRSDAAPSIAPPAPSPNNKHINQTKRGPAQRCASARPECPLLRSWPPCLLQELAGTHPAPPPGSLEGQSTLKDTRVRTMVPVGSKGKSMGPREAAVHKHGATPITDYIPIQPQSYRSTDKLQTTNKQECTDTTNQQTNNAKQKQHQQHNNETGHTRVTYSQCEVARAAHSGPSGPRFGGCAGAAMGSQATAVHCTSRRGPLQERRILHEFFKATSVPWGLLCKAIKQPTGVCKTSNGTKSAKCYSEFQM